jgi:hypothetical protein
VAVAAVLATIVIVQIRQCRDIQAILVKYGLPGPATRFLGVLEADDWADPRAPDLTGTPNGGGCSPA